MEHLPYGGSSAKRTINCPGWLEKSKGITPRPAGAAAIEGSMHHMIMEVCQKENDTPEDNLGMLYTENGIQRYFTEDDLDLSEIAYNATNKLLDDLDIDQMMIEPFVQLIPGVAGGSIDLLGLSADEETILFLDYKFGTVKVPVKETEQGGVYGISARHDKTTADLFKHVKKIIFAIIQPKAKGVVFLWETDPEWLDGFLHRFQNAMVSTEINPGSHCKYCPAEPYCEEKRLNVIASNLLGARELEELQAGANVIVEVEDWVKAMKEELYLQMNRGLQIKGWKIIDKRPTTKWTDEAGAKAFMKDKRIAAKDIIKPASLMTPIQVGKILKKKGKDLSLDEFIVSESSGTTLALESHNSPAVIVSDVQGHLKDMMK
jgi:hypothetical protein